MALNPDTQTPEGFLRQELMSDESLEEEVRQEIEQSRYDKLAQKIEDYTGVTADDLLKADDEQKFEDDGTEDLEALRQRQSEQREEALRCAAKLIRGGEYSHLRIDDLLLWRLGERIYAMDPTQSMATLARRTLEAATTYRGQGRMMDQKRNQAYADSLHHHKQMIKHGGIAQKRAEDAKKYAEGR